MAAAPLPSDHSTSTIADHLNFRNPNPNPNPNPKPKPKPKPRTDPNPNPQMPSIIQSTRCKSTISSLLLSTFSNDTTKHTPTPKKSFKTHTLRGLGCAARPEVTVPGIIRSSADWEERENTLRKNHNNKNKKKKKKKRSVGEEMGLMEDPLGGAGSVGVQDFWCGDASAAASVDCVRPVNHNNLANRGKIDLDKLHHRERASYNSRQRVTAEHFAAPGLDSGFDVPPFGPDVFEARYYHHLRNRTPDGLAEILMFQNGLLTGRRSGGADRYRDLRLDVDSMTYEELLELGDRIGHVSTGLGDDQIGRCLRKTKMSVLNKLQSQPHISAEIEGKCSICQEEYEAEEEVGKLECGHAYHLHCIKQWLVRKNACPVCKAEASSL